MRLLERRSVTLLLLVVAIAEAFLPSHAGCSRRRILTPSSQGEQQQQRSKMVARPMEEDATEQEDIVWIDESEDDDDADVVEAASNKPSKNKLKSSRWDALNPAVKARLVKTGQERAIANKKKTESAHTKKRRMMMYMKTKQQEKKRAARVKRPVQLGMEHRTPLSALIPGMELTGVCISLTTFGAYIDVGTECDGLLHISQLSADDFIQHPRQVVQPGDEVTVRVRSTNPDKKKLHLTMLPIEVLQAEQEDQESEDDRIALTEIQVDDELWGELKRVTDYGAYVEVGAAVDGFLHFMDHPSWDRGLHPTEFMKRGDRVRVWVSDVDTVQNRIKLTANRPQYLPGPRREF